MHLFLLPRVCSQPSVFAVSSCSFSTFPAPLPPLWWSDGGYGTFSALWVCQWSIFWVWIQTLVCTRVTHCLNSEETLCLVVITWISCLNRISHSENVIFAKLFTLPFFPRSWWFSALLFLPFQPRNKLLLFTLVLEGDVYVMQRSVTDEETLVRKQRTFILTIWEELEVQRRWGNRKTPKS